MLEIIVSLEFCLSEWLEDGWRIECEEQTKTTQVKEERKKLSVILSFFFWNFNLFPFLLCCSPWGVSTSATLFALHILNFSLNNCNEWFPQLQWFRPSPPNNPPSFMPFQPLSNIFINDQSINQTIKQPTKQAKQNHKQTYRHSQGWLLRFKVNEFLPTCLTN